MRTDENRCIPIDGAYYGNDLVGIGFYLRPGHSVGFITDVVNDVVFVLVLIGNGCIECFGPGQVIVWIPEVQLVQVVQCIHTTLGSFFDQSAYLCGETCGIGFVSVDQYIQEYAQNDGDQAIG